MLDFNLNTIVKYNNLFFNRYNPLINYTWSTQVTGGVVELIDSGTSPKYHAEMNSGKGVLGNGVDMSISIGGLV